MFVQDGRSDNQKIAGHGARAHADVELVDNRACVTSVGDYNQEIKIAIRRCAAADGRTKQNNTARLR